MGYYFGQHLTTNMQSVCYVQWATEMKILDADSTAMAATVISHRLRPTLEQYRDEELKTKNTSKYITVLIINIELPVRTDSRCSCRSFSCDGRELTAQQHREQQECRDDGGSEVRAGDKHNRCAYDPATQTSW